MYAIAGEALLPKPGIVYLPHLAEGVVDMLADTVCATHLLPPSGPLFIIEFICL